MLAKKISLFVFVFTIHAYGQNLSNSDLKNTGMINEVSSSNLEKNVKRLSAFGTRPSFSPVNENRGIETPRKWVKGEFDKIVIQLREANLSFWQRKSYTEGNEFKITYSKDNNFIAVKSVDENGHESIPVFPVLLK
jgi:hypothetical protein